MDTIFSEPHTARANTVKLGDAGTDIPHPEKPQALSENGRWVHVTLKTQITIAEFVPWPKRRRAFHNSKRGNAEKPRHVGRTKQNPLQQIKRMKISKLTSVV